MPRLLVCVCSQVLARKGFFSTRAASSPGAIPLSQVAFSPFSPISDNLPVADPPNLQICRLTLVAVAHVPNPPPAA